MRQAAADLLRDCRMDEASARAAFLEPDYYPDATVAETTAAFNAAYAEARKAADRDRDAVPAVAFGAADPDPDGEVALPAPILEDGAGGVPLPAGEVGLLAGAGGGGKSRAVLQIAVAAAAAVGKTGIPFPGGGLRVASGPVVMLGYEDAAAWLAWRARRLARWLDRREGGDVRRHSLAIADPERLSVAVADYDAALFGVRLGDDAGALPRPLAAWRPLWDRVAAIRARLVVIDPAAVACQWEGHSALPVGAFVGAVRRELRVLLDPCAALVVCHTTKAARRAVRDGDDSRAEDVVGAGAWVDRARVAFMLDAGSGAARLSVAKANYAAQRTLCRLGAVNDGTGRPVAFEELPAEGDEDRDEDGVDQHWGEGVPL